MIPLQPNDRRTSQTTDPRSSGAQHTMRQSEASQEGLATRRTSAEMSPLTFSRHPSILQGPRNIEPPRYPSSLSLPQPPPGEPSGTLRREQGGLALSLQYESNDRSRNCIGSLLSPSTPHLSPHLTATSATGANKDLQLAASSSRMQVDQWRYGLVSAGYSLDERRRRGQGDFDDSGTASDFLMRTRRSRSPFQVDLTNPSDHRIYTPRSSDQATVSHPTANDPSANLPPDRRRSIRHRMHLAPSPMNLVETHPQVKGLVSGASRGAKVQRQLLGRLCHLHRWFRRLTNGHDLKAIALPSLAEYDEYIAFRSGVDAGVQGVGIR